MARSTVLTGATALLLLLAAADQGPAQPRPDAKGLELSVTLVPRPDQEGSISYFRYDLAAGQSGQDKVLLKNRAERPLELDVYPADGANTPDGGLTGPLMGEPNQAVGRWIAVSESHVVLQPGEEKALTIQLKVPEGARAGDHFGFVFLQAASEPDATPVESGQASFAVKLQTRYGITLWDRVPGDQQVALLINPPEKKIEKGKLILACRLENQGNMFLKPQASWRLVAADGGEVSRQEMTELGYLLPGSSLTLAVPVFSDRPLVRGKYRLELSARYGSFQEPLRSEQKSFELELP